MHIRVATPADKPKIVELYLRSQKATNIPDRLVYPPETLGDNLYARLAIERYVAVEDRTIIGHAMIEEPNPLSLPWWRAGEGERNSIRLIELGAAFVEPERMRSGIYTKLLDHRLGAISRLGAKAVSATWAHNQHVMKVFESRGGREVGRQKLEAGVLHLFRFDR